MTHKVFIDGEAGTTGLEVQGRLLAHPDITLIQLDASQRKDTDARREAMAAADAVILCLPDASAVAAAQMAEAVDVPVIDASTAHRVAADWVYGFPELTAKQRGAIQSSRQIANVGCYASAMIAMLRPLREAGLLGADADVSISAISGYSGGGKDLIAYMQAGESPRNFAYALNLAHKHLPEVLAHGDLEKAPIFTPMVGDFYAGMLVMMPLYLRAFRKSITINDIHNALAEHYADSVFMRTHAPNDAPAMHARGFLGVDDLIGTNYMDLHLFHPEGDAGDIGVLLARLDNLGKGAAGSAVQNLNLILGIDETTALI